MRLACWLPMHCPSRASCTSCPVSEPQQFSRTFRKHHGTDPSNYLSTAKRVFVAYQIEEEAPRGIGAMTRTMRTFTQFLDEV